MSYRAEKASKLLTSRNSNFCWQDAWKVLASWESICDKIAESSPCFDNKNVTDNAEVINLNGIEY